MKLYDCDCTDEWGNPTLIKDTRPYLKSCEVCGKKAYVVKRMPVDAEPDEDDIMVLYGNVCMDCVNNWDEIVERGRDI